MVLDPGDVRDRAAQDAERGAGDVAAQPATPAVGADPDGGSLDRDAAVMAYGAVPFAYGGAELDAPRVRVECDVPVLGAGVREVVDPAPVGDVRAA